MLLYFLLLYRAESAHAKLKRQLGSSQGNFETSWPKIHALLELQHTEIKASFEKSLMIVQHHFRREEFKNLRGLISAHAMNIVWNELKRIDMVGVDAVACGCIIRRTHGLPCGHELAEYKRCSRPIPLECIDRHWRKLDLVYDPQRDDDDIHCDAEIDLIMRRFKANPKNIKLELLKKLKELANPETTSILEPAVNQRPKGRPKGKIDDSTRRDPSDFEYILSTQNSTTLSLSPAVGQIKKTNSKAKGKKSTRKHVNKKVYYII